MLSLLLALAPVIITNGHTFTCTPTRIWDGHVPIWCAQEPRIRLAGIAAREMDETCRRGHPCPKATGRAARDHLVMLLGGSRGVTPQGPQAGVAVRVARIGQGEPHGRLVRGSGGGRGLVVPDGAGRVRGGLEGLWGRSGLP
jgi:endonuclease YncB( thermonuclease family)